MQVKLLGQIHLLYVSVSLLFFRLVKTGCWDIFEEFRLVMTEYWDVFERFGRGVLTLFKLWTSRDGLTGRVGLYQTGYTDFLD
jgi:hypothetical protein